MIHDPETEEITKVKCELQYFDELLREFVPFKTFDVHELDGTHVPIDVIESQALCALQWRLTLPGDGKIMNLERQGVDIRTIVNFGVQGGSNGDYDSNTNRSKI